MECASCTHGLVFLRGPFWKAILLALHSRVLELPIQHLERRSFPVWSGGPGPPAASFCSPREQGTSRRSGHPPPNSPPPRCPRSSALLGISPRTLSKDAGQSTVTSSARTRRSPPTLALWPLPTSRSVRLPEIEHFCYVHTVRFHLDLTTFTSLVAQLPLLLPRPSFWGHAVLPPR